MYDDIRPHWTIIANPVAGRGRVRRLWPQVERALQTLGFNYAVHFTRERGHAETLADTALRNGARYLLGIGGDGLNHEIANGIMSQEVCPAKDVTYALLPMGTGNDWARHYRIPTHPLERLRRLIQPQTCLQDMGLIRYCRDGRAENRWFVNVAGLAYDGFIGQKLMQHPPVNRFHFLWMVVRRLFEYRLRQASLRFDGLCVADRFYTINVGLCRYSGGGMQLAPHAVADDGLFALTYAGALSKLGVLLQMPRFYNGGILRHPKVHGAQAREISIEAVHGAPPTPLEADGEYLGETPVSFQIYEKALRIAL
ncbi:MAG: diacylglycerol/lipid kinase family protein [Saprospiraceae bacterium]